MGLHNRIGSIFWLIIGSYVAISAYRLGLGKFDQPGPGFIFFLASILLIALSLIDIGMTSIKMPKMDEGNDENILWEGVRWQKVLLLLAGISIYICMFNYLGFILSTFLLMIFLFKVVEATKWWISIFSSFVTVMISIGLFKYWLKAYFPIGFLGF